MADALTPLAQSIFEAADKACGNEFATEGEFFTTLTERVHLTNELESGVIAQAIVEIVNSGRWPWGRS